MSVFEYRVSRGSNYCLGVAVSTEKNLTEKTADSPEKTVMKKHRRSKSSDLVVSFSEQAKADTAGKIRPGLSVYARCINVVGA